MSADILAFVGQTIRAAGPNQIVHVEVWSGISKETCQPVYGVDYVFGDGSRASMSLRDTWSDAMRDARECADGRFPIREGQP